MQRKISYAGTVSRSFSEGSVLMEQLADMTVSAKQVERVTRRIGAERVVERNAAVTTFQELPLAEKFAVPAGVTPPDLAVVMVDGGRLQILDRAGSSALSAAGPAAVAAADQPSPPATAQRPAADTAAAAAEEAWDEEKTTTGHWRENRIGLLLTMTSAVSASDPCPEVPAAFVDALRIPKLARELSKHAKQGDNDASATAGPEATPVLPEATAYEPPEVVQRQVVATRRRWRSFAPLLAQAAWAQGFQGATRKAFVGDGSANNWRLQRRFFGSFEPILDFIHALSYVYAAATAGREPSAGWACYREWIAWVWQGQVGRVMAALAERQVQLGVPEEDEAATSPRVVVARTLTYLRNQHDKMRYDDYRRQGLPLTSSMMESVVKQIGRRVKGTEKFWSEAGAEALLQLRADYLSDGAPLEGFWQRRQEAATGQRRYRHAA